MIQIKKLTIRRFRGIRNFSWLPEAGLNLIIGGGDCGKTTILEAIGLLFHSGTSSNLTEADYWKRESENGFEIEAVISTKSDFEFSSGSRVFWPWEWNGTDAVQPKAEADEVPEPQTPAYRIIVSASPEFEIAWEIIQPDGSHENFPLGIRRRIGLVKLSGDDKNDRDLRLVYGSALDRLLSEANLRSKISQTISNIQFKDELSADAQKAVQDLDEQLQKEELPSGLSIGIIGSQGISIGALIGLLALRDDISLPLSSWGAGTRRMASLQIAASNKSDAKIAIIDEIERGLEPYRLRQFIENLISSEEQCFVTTHSAVAVSSSTAGQLWYLDATNNIGKLQNSKVAAQQARDPETFLSKIAVIAEGQTEVGFIHAILEKLFAGNALNAGVRVCLGQGDSQLLELLEELEASGITFCGFADNDSGKAQRWTDLKAQMGGRLFQWPSGCIETNIIPLLPLHQLEKLFQDQDGDWDGHRLRTVAVRLGSDEKDFEKLLEAADGNRETLREHLIKAAIGDTSDVVDGDEGETKATKKAWKKHAQSWFKKHDGSGGRELLRHLVETQTWPSIEGSLIPFFNSILNLADKKTVEAIEL